MKSKDKNRIIMIRQESLSKAGYLFHPNNEYWQLDKNTKIPVGSVYRLLDDLIAENYLNVLVYYASNLSASHTRNINERFLHMLKTTGVSIITDSALINYRAALTKNTEWYLGTIRGFLKKWHELGYAGISDNVIDLLDGWTIKGNIKGDVIKRLDPVSGPLSDIELQAFNEGAVQAYEKNAISFTDMALGLSISNTGRRPIQISHLRLKDVLKGSNKKDESIYLLNMPRAKQRATEFRGQFKQFAITQELWSILSAQAVHAAQSVEKVIGFKLQEMDRLELPLFPDLDASSKIKSPQKLRDALKTDLLHIQSVKISETCKFIADVAEIHSERTGQLLNISSNRFRYTIGTRAAREGFGEMVIAELLDHSDTQNAGVYIKNIPEHVEKLDQAVGHYLAPYAQAFAGVLVDSESHAKRGNDLNSRVKVDGDGIGTCGNYGVCGANVPIPCYTCMHFQPWLDGQHEIVYNELIAERERLFGDMQIAAVNDRTIFAVADVIQRCATRREELANG
ncbi:site-specific integrase [Methylobacter sp.]|uniref:site-specific integrase n=1 Tax=Methylobacter sp. TaxID=2051955 RepID=UPI002FDE3448